MSEKATKKTVKKAPQRTPTSQQPPKSMGAPAQVRQTNNPDPRMASTPAFPRSHAPQHGIARAPSAGHSHGLYQRLRETIAAKAFEKVSEKSSRAQQECPCDLASLCAVCCEAFPDAALAEHVLHTFCDHKDATLESFVDQTSDLVIVLSAV